jgi:hypothetical protein
MTSLAHKPARFQIGPLADLRREVRAGVRLRLLPSGDGWSLVAPDGKLVYQSLGIGGRRDCLEFARAHGVLAILS